MKILYSGCLSPAFWAVATSMYRLHSTPEILRGHNTHEPRRMQQPRPQAFQYGAVSDLHQSSRPRIDLVHDLDTPRLQDRYIPGQIGLDSRQPVDVETPTRWRKRRMAVEDADNDVISDACNSRLSQDEISRHQQKRRGVDVPDFGESREPNMRQLGHQTSALDRNSHYRPQFVQQVQNNRAQRLSPCSTSPLGCSIRQRPQLSRRRLPRINRVSRVLTIWTPCLKVILKTRYTMKSTVLHLCQTPRISISRPLHLLRRTALKLRQVRCVSLAHLLLPMGKAIAYFPQMSEDILPLLPRGVDPTTADLRKLMITILRPSKWPSIAIS